MSSGFVIGAFGKHSKIDKKLKRKFADETTGYYGIKFHIRISELANIDESRIYIFRGENIYAGINSVSGEEAAVCFLERKRSGSISPSDHLARLFEDNQLLSKMFNNQVPDLKQQKVYGAGNIYFGRKELVKDGIIMIGDAAKIIAPLAGDGIGMAFQSAKTAAEIIKEAIKNKMNSRQMERMYKAKWTRLFSGRTITAGFIQNIVLQNSYLGMVPDWLINRLVPRLIEATRK